ncbi:MAG: YggS family pyridoxal phosphate-dependent enzyme [Planctomycetota bacterium]|jgi:pyridoxal phosphate enzyme (YggS family)
MKAKNDAPAPAAEPAADTRTLRERYDDVRARVARAAEKSGRRASDIVLVAVTKYASIEDIRELVSFGHLDLGENRVQQLMQRAAIIEEFQARRRERGADAPAVRWHMIGSLQRNKVKKAVELSRLIHSVDSLRLAEEIQEVAEARPGDGHAPVDVLVEVNVAGERSKHGVAPAAARHLVDMIDTMVALRPRGLMCMAPTPKPGEAPDLEAARRTFVRCKELFDEIRTMRQPGDRFDILSMGMSGDYELAIECGANVVRVGSAIFGESSHGQHDETPPDGGDDE